MRRVLLIGILLLTTIMADAAVKYDAKREKAYRARVAKFMAVQARKQQLAAKTTRQPKSQHQD